MVNDVVRMLPLVSWTGVIPFPDRRVDFWIPHPVPLSMQNVMANFHIFKDLCQCQQTGADADDRVKYIPARI